MPERSPDIGAASTAESPGPVRRTRRARVWAVAWREFKHTALTKAFILAAIGVPLLIVVAMLITVGLMMNQQPAPLSGTIAIIDPTGRLAAAAAVEFADAAVDPQWMEQLESAPTGLPDMSGVTGVPANARDLESIAEQAGLRGTVDVAVESIADLAAVDRLKGEVRDGSLLGFAIVDAAVLTTPDVATGTDPPPSFRLFLPEDTKPQHARLLERCLGRAVVRVRALSEGVDLDRARAMLEQPTVDTIKLREDGKETPESAGIRELQEMIPIMFLMLLWTSTITSGQHLMMSTIEEKSNRVMEVLLSAVSPVQLMCGKILGQGLVGIILICIYSSLGIVALIVFALMHLVPMIQLVYLGVYFVMAYLMIASMMAAVGSAVSEIREANSLLMPVMVVVMFPLLLWFPISDDPNGPIATTFSFIPPAIPFVMILRIPSAEAVPFWQIPVTMIWGGICTWAMIWMAAKIFRVGVLMYGKPPTPWQLLKWLRYA